MRTPEQKARRAAAEKERRANFTPEQKTRAHAQKIAHKERNRDSINAKSRAQHAADPNRQRNRQLKHKYGMNVEQWDALFASQGFTCAICSSDKPNGRHWHTDHCHSTGTVRGILCHHCNLLLGNARDNSHTLAKAIDYLGKHNG